MRLGARFTTSLTASILILTASCLSGCRPAKDTLKPIDQMPPEKYYTLFVDHTLSSTRNLIPDGQSFSDPSLKCTMYDFQLKIYSGGYCQITYKEQGASANSNCMGAVYDCQWALSGNSIAVITWGVGDRRIEFGEAKLDFSFGNAAAISHLRKKHLTLRVSK